MKTLILKTLLFLILLLGLMYSGAELLDEGKRKNDYLNAILLKQERAESIDSPRIILGGGSGQAFNMNSLELEMSLGKQVVNMGLHAGLGIEMLMGELQALVQKDDTIILSLAYSIPEEGDDKLIYYLQQIFPESKNYENKSQAALLRRWMGLKYSSFQRLTHQMVFAFSQEERKSHADVYRLYNFNSFGDLVIPPDAVKPEFLHDRENLTTAVFIPLHYLNELAAHCETMGAQLFFSFPFYPESEWKKNRKVIEAAYEYYQEHATCLLLNHPSENILPDEYFFDTIYHLTPEGKQIATAKIIADLLDNGQ